MPNRNAAKGRKAEEKFIETAGRRVEVIEKIKQVAELAGIFLPTGQNANKFIEIRFESVYANFMSYEKVATNQTTRMSIGNFVKNYGLTDAQHKDLRELVLEKGTAPRKKLFFPPEKQKKWKEIIEPRAAQIIKDSISAGHPSKEILVLYERSVNEIRIWKMTEILEAIGNRVDFTTQGGNMTLGTCFVLQRKGGDGNSKRKREDPKHPGNDIQINIDIKNFMEKHKNLIRAIYRP